MRSALTIAGSDPTGGAGLQLDLKVFRAFDVHGLSVCSAITAQNTREVKEVYPVYYECVREQIETLLADIRPVALKTGMLFSKSAVEAVAEAVRAHKLDNMVIDPVTVSSSGTSLVEEGMLDHLKRMLFPMATVITPNIYEASLLASRIIESPSDMQAAAEALLELGPRAVVITGGHLEGLITDLYCDRDGVQRFHGEKFPGEFHGTGCAFSAALAAGLAKGDSPASAAAKAREFVANSIRNSYCPGQGMNILGI